ncbi:MAG: hypothetical protein SVU32_03920 [Candidatus Nanohaloarchaea archaeon]|nr:hypothetical protein [Candidatus Nanohaloarchaea archaeon]
MELLEPLQEELEQNFEIAKGTENLIKEERDMLQGETEQRVALFTLSTDVWESVIHAGTLSNFEETSGPVSDAYRQTKQLNTLIEKFNRYGNSILYTPLLKQTTSQYNRKQLLDIIAEMCSEVSVTIMDAKDQLSDIVQTECPVCGRRFSTRQAMKSHVTQKNDPEHEAIKDRIA